MNDNTQTAESESSDAELDENDFPTIRPALELLAQLRDGAVMNLLSAEINRVVRGVVDCSDAKVGQVQLTLKIGRMKRMARAVQIQAVVVGKAPEDPPDYDLMFYDDDGNLHANDPSQKDFFRGPRPS